MSDFIRQVQQLRVFSVNTRKIRTWCLVCGCKCQLTRDPRRWQTRNIIVPEVQSESYWGFWGHKNITFERAATVKLSTKSRGVGYRWGRGQIVLFYFLLL